MIERAIFCDYMLQRHKPVIIQKLSGELLIPPDTVSELLNEGMKKGQIRFDDFYNQARGYIHVQHSLSN